MPHDNSLDRVYKGANLIDKIMKNGIQVYPRLAATVTKAVFGGAGTGLTLSGSNRIATATSSVDKNARFQFPRTTGDYWVEVEWLAGSDVVYNCLGMANASSNMSSYLGVDANSVGVYEGPSGWSGRETTMRGRQPWELGAA